MIVETPKTIATANRKFLSLALAANATLIISGDQDLLTLHPYKNIPIITARQFIDDYPF